MSFAVLKSRYQKMQNKSLRLVTGQLKGRGGPGRLGIRRGMRQRGGATGRGAIMTGRGAARGGAGARGQDLQDIFIDLNLCEQLYSTRTPGRLLLKLLGLFQVT